MLELECFRLCWPLSLSQWSILGLSSHKQTLLSHGDRLFWCTFNLSEPDDIELVTPYTHMCRFRERMLCVVYLSGWMVRIPRIIHDNSFDSNTALSFVGKARRFTMSIIDRYGSLVGHYPSFLLSWWGHLTNNEAEKDSCDDKLP